MMLQEVEWLMLTQSAAELADAKQVVSQQIEATFLLT